MKTSFIVPIYQFNDELFKLSRNMFMALDEVEGIERVEKIIIDNGSSLGADTLKENADTYVHNRENLGYCKAVNQGYKLATGDIIVVGNNDIKMSPNFLNVAKEILAENPKVGSVHFRMIPYMQDFNPGQDTWIEGKERWAHASLYVIRREAIPEGLYDENYAQGGMDDWDFFHRMRHINGWLSAYTNRAEFAHHDSSTYRALDERDKDRAIRDQKNRRYFQQKFGEDHEVIWDRLYHDQMILPWLPFP